MEDRHEATRQVMRQLAGDAHWEAVADTDMPAELRELVRGYSDAYREGDLDWLLEHTDPEIEIVQVPEIPGSRTYTGREGMVEAILDWPRQWEDFRFEPRRIFAPNPDNLILIALHRGRSSAVGIEVEAEIVFALRLRDGRMTRWDMFLTLDEALGRAAERGAHARDDDAAEGDGGERAQEARAEELRPDHR
jgi:ketosteroid isomerase-like protein